MRIAAPKRLKKTPGPIWYRFTLKTSL